MQYSTYQVPIGHIQINDLKILTFFFFLMSSCNLEMNHNHIFGEIKRGWKKHNSRNIGRTKIGLKNKYLGCDTEVCKKRLDFPNQQPVSLFHHENLQPWAHLQVQKGQTGNCLQQLSSRPHFLSRV